MEGLTKRIWIVAGTFFVAGLVFSAVPKVKQKDFTEEEVAAMLPVKVGRFDAELARGEYCSYKMDQATYDILRPWGIVARIFSDGPESYDMTVIASRSKESFHDPQICFKAQGWNLTNQRLDYVNTKSKGQLPITMVDMEKDGYKTVAAYFFRTNTGYIGNIKDVKLSMLKYKLTHMMKDDEGAFIRVIPRSTKNEEKLKEFIGNWIDEANRTSKGYY